MAMIDEAQPRRPAGERQGTALRISLVLLAALLPGCAGVERMNDSKLTIETPIDWWHDLQGGKIAELRPPPPGVTDPYPNLSQVPARPVPTDPATRHALAAQLAAQRDRTQREAAQDPLVQPAPVTAAPSPPATAPADPNASVVVLDGAAAPPTRPTPPAPPAAPPGPAARSLAASGPIPDLPMAPPPIPQLAGLPASTFAPPVPRTPPGVAVAFPPGSAALPQEADAALRNLAGRRSGGLIAVTAGGDANGPGAEAQARALPLALRRTEAMGAVLVAAGVPPAALRLDAAALGRGGQARLIQ